jgi:glycosyltransferase involved in cell wall biosynthesis
LPLLIAACDRLRANGEQFSVSIIGDGEMRSTLEADVRRRRLDGVVSFLGVRTSAEIREHLLGARAFVLPSFAEGLPVVIMEALVLSRPVIATAIAGIPELVDGECGRLIPAGSEEALVNALTEALHAPSDDLSARGAAGRERVRQMHDAAHNAAQLIEAIGRASLRPPQPN